MVSLKTILVIGLAVGVVAFLVSPAGKQGIAELKKLGGETKSYTKKLTDKIDSSLNKGAK